jgi:hypothetical protein
MNREPTLPNGEPTLHNRQRLLRNNVEVRDVFAQLVTDRLRINSGCDPDLQPTPHTREHLARVSRATRERLDVIRENVDNHAARDGARHLFAELTIQRLQRPLEGPSEGVSMPLSPLANRQRPRCVRRFRR